MATGSKSGSGAKTFLGTVLNLVQTGRQSAIVNIHTSYTDLIYSSFATLGTSSRGVNNDHKSGHVFALEHITYFVKLT